MKNFLILFLIYGVVGLSIAFNHYRPTDTEINAKIAVLCQDHKEIPCDKITSYCRQSLAEGHECYLNTNPK